MKALGPKVPDLIILSIYSALPSEVQSRVFEPTPPGARNVVIAHPSGTEEDDISEERDSCIRHVFYYFECLPTYTQVIPVNACSGSRALYEWIQERYGSPENGSQTPSPNNGLICHNSKPLKLPGGSILPVKSSG